MDDFDPIDGHDEELDLLLVAVHEVNLVYRDLTTWSSSSTDPGGGSNLIL